MPELLDDKWQSRDFPTLRAVAKIADENLIGAQLRDVAEATGLTTDETMLSFRALEDAGMFEVRWMMGGGDSSRATHMSGEARKLVGLWPSPDSAADRLLAAIDQAAERSSDPGQRSRLQRAGEALRSAGRDITVGVATAVLTGQLPQ